MLVLHFEPSELLSACHIVILISLLDVVGCVPINLNCFKKLLTKNSSMDRRALTFEFVAGV